MKKLILAIAIATSLPAYAVTYEAAMSRIADQNGVTGLGFCRIGMPERCDPVPGVAATKRYKELLKKLQTKAQKDALKAYLVALLSEFEGATPNGSETTRAYDARQTEASRRTKEAWLNFELEL